MVRNLLASINHEVGGLSFLIRNLRAARHLSAMQPSHYQDYLLEGLSKRRLKDFNELHKLVREGRGLNFWRKFYLFVMGRKICCIAIDSNDKLVGFNYYYFKPKEANEKIIHDAFLGISPSARSKGLATALQTYAVEQFSKQGLIGVSGNVEKANHPSVKMLRRVGFTLFDDPDSAENFKIFYDFQNNSSANTY